MSVALMKLYKSIGPQVKIYQTRWPVGKGLASSPDTQLTELVDWWCPHVVQWSTPGVPEALSALRAARAREAREFHVTVYDNGVPISEAPWERTRFEGWDVWRSNKTLDGTLSWYSINTYGLHDPWVNPYPAPKPHHTVVTDPAGWGYQLWPPPPSQRNNTMWAPIESVVWVMLGAGIQEAEYLYALERHTGSSPRVDALLAQARQMALAFPCRWNAGCPSNTPNMTVDWGDDGYVVDQGGHLDGSSVVNTWKLAAAAELGKLEY